VNTHFFSTLLFFLQPSGAMRNQSPAEKTLSNWYLAEAIFVYAGLEGSSRLARCSKTAAQHWRRACVTGVLPQILRFWRGMSLRTHAPLLSFDEHLVFPCTANRNACVRETLLAGVQLSVDECTRSASPVPAAYSAQCILTLRLPGPDRPPVDSLLLLPDPHTHGPRVRLACKTLAKSLGPEKGAQSLACARKALGGSVPETACLLFIWIHARNRGRWPSFPSPLYGASIDIAKNACKEAGEEGIAGAVVAGAVVSAHFAFRAALREPLHPGRVPFQAAGAKEAWLFALRNGPYFPSPPMDLMVYWEAYRSDSEAGLLRGTATQKSAWTCAQRYLRGEACLAPQPVPSLKRGMSPGIGRQAWQQTVLPERHGLTARALHKRFCLAGFFYVTWEDLPTLVVHMSSGAVSLSPFPVTSKKCPQTPWVFLVCRKFDEAWVAKWHPDTLSLLNGPVPLRCRVLQGLKSGVPEGEKKKRRRQPQTRSVCHETQ